MLRSATPRGGELPRIALSARNIAQSETEQPGQDIVATCAACWLAARESKERLDGRHQLMKETNEALAAAGLHVTADRRCVTWSRC